MEKIEKVLDRFGLKKYQVGLYAIIVLVNMPVYYVGRLLTMNRNHTNLTTAFDDRIPLIPAMIIVYWGCYIYWVISYLIALSQDYETAKKFAIAEIAGKIVCFVIFMVFPTTMTRPEITGTDVFSQLMKFLYFVDMPDMLFPSIHCYVSWMCYLGVKDMPNLKRKWKILILLIAVLVCISTVTCKQHVVYDIFGGVLLAEISYRIVFSRKRWDLFKRKSSES